MQLQILGVLVILLGIGLIFGHRSLWSKVKQNDQLHPDEVKFAQTRYMRRTFISTLLTLLGVMLIAGTFIDQQKYPSFFVMFWLLVMSLAVIMAILAFFDLSASRRSIKDKMAVVNAKRKEMEKQLNLLKQHEQGDDELN